MENNYQLLAKIALKNLLSRKDKNIFGNPAYFEACLGNEGVPAGSETLRSLTLSIRFRIPHEITKRDAIFPNDFEFIVKNFSDHAFLGYEKAKWVVETWLEVLNKKIVGETSSQLQSYALTDKSDNTSDKTESNPNTVETRKDAIVDKDLGKKEEFFNRNNFHERSDDNGNHNPMTVSSCFNDALADDSQGIDIAVGFGIDGEVVVLGNNVHFEKDEEKYGIKIVTEQVGRKTVSVTSSVAATSSVPEKPKASETTSIPSSTPTPTSTPAAAPVEHPVSEHDPIEDEALNLLKNSKRDPETVNRVIQMLRPFADKGSAFACRVIGQIYFEGFGVQKTEQSMRAAKDWLKIAAEQNESKACYYLGQIYRDGVCGERPDIMKAIQYFQIAASNGNKKAAEALAKL